MTPTYHLRDLFTGEDVPIPDHHYDEPTEAWVEGWNASMYNGLPDNPYDPHTTEGHDWQDGYDAAERD